jgi:hypothetical protein
MSAPFIPHSQAVLGNAFFTGQVKLWQSGSFPSTIWERDETKN